MGELYRRFERKSGGEDEDNGVPTIFLSFYNNPPALQRFNY